MARPKKKKEPKITKKQIGNLDKAEARKLAVFGMGLGLKASFEMSPAEQITWISEHQANLLEADIPSCDSDGLFRPGVVDYLLALQQYLRGEVPDPPEWNDGATPEGLYEVPPQDETSPLAEPIEEDEGPAELVEFPNYTEQEPEAPKEEVKMTKPVMRTGTTTTAPPTFLRRTKEPVPAKEEPPVHKPEEKMVPQNAPEPEEPAPAAPTPPQTQAGLSAEEAHALIEMVGETAEQVAGLPEQLAAINEKIDARVDDLRSRLDVPGVHKKVDSIKMELREVSAQVLYLTNAVALLVNFWRPMGQPYRSLADVPDPATYVDEIAETEGE